MTTPNALDAIAEALLGERKIPVDAMAREAGWDGTTNIFEWVWVSAPGLLEAYNDRDVDLMVALEKKTGFIDLHPHLDAQIGWDPDLTPVSWHGVTTALMGNCGVTFAPCKPSDRELLAAMMETVEDIPKNAILTGLPWDWEDYGGYLDAIERLQPGINVAGLVGHCAVRFYVMGERAVEEQASDRERPTHVLQNSSALR